MAKKQATKAHENSYLGAVLRGEKNMKRFVRSCGGQVPSSFLILLTK
jgi:hypothetical protein